MMYNHVLMTGAAGVIGRVLREALRGVYPALRLSHRRPFGDPKPGEEIVLANLDNYDEVDAAMEGVDAVVSAIKAVQADEPPAEGLFQGGPYGAVTVSGNRPVLGQAVGSL
jgi:nucleoside-diphosphate-sugar epimerase